MTALPAQAPASVGVPVNVDSPGLTYVVAKIPFSAVSGDVLFPEHHGTEVTRRSVNRRVPSPVESTGFQNSRAEAAMAKPEDPETTAGVLRRGMAMLADRLPAEWSARIVATELDQGMDGLIELVAPDGQSTTLIVEAKRVVEARDVSAIREQLERYVQTKRNAQGLVAARYLSPPVRARLAKEGLSYVDATGNLRVEVSSPGLFLSDRGADRDPWRGPGRPRGTLKGAPAARIVRAVSDFRGPWAVRELVDVARVSTGAAYRVVDYLEREDLATRQPDGKVAVPDWVRLLRRWSDDYGFVRDSRITRWIAPRGLPGLMKRVADTGGPTPYAVSGTLAAAEWAAYAPARVAMIYVGQPEKAADQWGLRPADAGANVMLAEPALDVVFERRLTNKEGVVVAAPTQVAVDLMTGPGRSPNEAEELLDWMRRNEQSWRN